MPNPNIQGLRVKNTSSHAEGTTQGIGRRAFLSQLWKAAADPQHLLQGMVKTECPSFIPFSGMNQEEKLRGDISDKLLETQCSLASF